MQSLFYRFNQNKLVHNKLQILGLKTFYVSLILSILLLVGGFLSPPLGIIDSSVLSAVGLLFAFATLALLPKMLAAIAQGRTFRLTKGDLTAEVASNSGET